MKLFDLFDENQFQAAHVNGYIRASHHPDLDLAVFCYTEKTVYEEKWDDVTRKCRGLVVTGDNEIVAHCMPKFFNASEHIDGRAYTQPLPAAEPFQIFKKADGSLITLFHYEGKWRTATKGSFITRQAQWAQRWIDEHDLSELPTGNTYALEAIYPENRIVVDNGSQQTLTLLAVFNADGREVPLTGYAQAWERIGGTVIEEYPAAKLSKILFYAQRNKTINGQDVKGTEAEGYVIKYRSGIRVKVKFADYIKIHGVVTGLTERHIWELLKDGRDLHTLFEVLPDEYHDWVTTTAERLSISMRVQATGLIRHLTASEFPSDPREFRAYAEGRREESQLFSVYDLISQHAWTNTKPAAIGPWKERD